MPIKLIAADKSDVGRQREQNEDCSYKRVESTGEGDRGLFIVADGMGGYQAGEVASRIAVDTISKDLNGFFQPLSEQPTIKLPAPQEEDDDATIVISRVKAEDEEKFKTRNLPETPISRSVEEQLKNAIQQANRAIVSYGEHHSSSRGLGSTVTAVLVENEQAYVANVGDSRTYLLRSGNLSPLTKDHSLVAKLVEARQIEPEDVYSHPQRNLIYRSLGAGHKNIDVDVFHETLKPNDTLLLCSDGLWEMVRHDDLLKALSEQASPQAICDKLITLANANGGEDNITAVVVHVSAV
jgi:protein phosphatase